MLADSWTIACYLDETYGRAPALFGGDIARATTRFIHAWGDQRQAGDLVPMLVLDAWKHVHPADRGYFRQTRERRMGRTLEDVVADRDTVLPRFRTALEPLRSILSTQPFVCGDRAAYADYIAFSHFQWARSVSPYRLLEPEDPVYGWRERMLDLFDGLARREPGYSV